MGGRGLAVVVASLALCVAGTARAQSVARSSTRTSSAPEAALGRFGVGAALRGLESDDPRDRERSVERLGSLAAGAQGSDEARVALVDALEPGLLRGEARLAAIRAVATRADDDDARGALVRELLQADAPRRDTTRGQGAAGRGIAALALARSGSDRALSALGAAVAQGGPAAVAARDALLAFPPARLEPMLGRTGPRATARVDGRVVAPPLLALLGELGDVRALPILRGALGAASPASRAQAALALARLGDEAALSFLRGVAAGDVEARVVAAEVRARLGERGAAAAIAQLLRDGATRDHGVRIARLAPDPALAGPLVATVEALPPDRAADALAALGACGGSTAIAALGGWAAAPGARAVPAAVALGRAPGPEAADALAAALARPDTSDTFVLAAVIRALAVGDEVEGLEGALRRLAASGGAARAELGVFGLVALRMLEVDAALDARPPTIAEVRWWGAVARGAIAAGSDARRALGERWLAGPAADRVRWPAAAIALLEPDMASRFPTTRLLEATIDGGPPTPLAARELARRDDGSLRAHVDRLASGVDPVVRAHVASGLGDSPDPAVASRLAAMALGDDDPSVRAAAVRALSRRSEPQRVRVLALTADLDPDASVRALARLGLRGGVLRDPPIDAGDVGITVVDVASAGDASGATWTARVRRPDGATLPVVVPTGGWLIVPGLGAGASALLLAEPGEVAVEARPGLSRPPGPAH